MPTPPIFPVLAGQGWSVHKRPNFSTRVAKHVSGREVRAPFFSSVLYEFEVTFDGLDSNGAYPSLDTNSLQSLMGLYLQCQGQYGTFLYADPSDNTVTSQRIAIGDGITTDFQFVRTFGGVAEPISWVTGVSAIYMDGIEQSSGWSLTIPHMVSFVSAPNTGTVITASFSYAFECRFLDDQIDFDNFMSGLWKVESLKFRMVRS